MKDEIKTLLDCDKITVYGPRKSFGVLLFKERDGESFPQVKERMWGVIRIIKELKHVWPSAAATSSKPAWASFLKTKGARQRTAYASMLRRIAIELAEDAKNEEGGPKQPHAIVSETYDVDWGAGTTWKHQWKLGSSTHRQPKGADIRVMTGGWADVHAISQATGATSSEVIQALERELNQ